MRAGRATAIIVELMGARKVPPATIARRRRPWADRSGTRSLACGPLTVRLE
jgi:hypothetical protein